MYSSKEAFRAAGTKSLLLILVAFFLTQNAYSQEDNTGLTPQQVAKIKTVDDAVISSDGNYIAYLLDVQADPTEKNERSSNHLYLMNLMTGESTPFVTTMSVSSIDFRPKHEAVTFLGKRDDDETTSLYQMSLSGGEALKIFSFKTSIAGYSWASDGNHLAFMAGDPGMIKKKESPLPYQPEVYEENLTQHRGYVTNVAKANHPPHKMMIEGSIYQMKWAPNNKKLAIAVAPTPLVDDYYMAQQVKIVDHHGKEVLGEVDHKGKLGQIAWSPDGNHLALTAGADINDPIAGRLFVVSSDGGSPTNILPDFKGMVEQVKWTGNKTLHYLSSEGVWSAYKSINQDGSQKKTIIEPGGPILHSFSRAGNGTTAFIADSPTHPSELYIMKKTDNKAKRVTHSNPWMKDISFGKQEVVTWQARDGKQLQGVLVYPLNHDAEKRYPLITVVHGGPESHYNNGWVTDYSDPGQVGAANGYFVFYPNYRGSTGRGEAFAKSSQGDLAGAEFDDIVDGVDELIKVGAVDGEKVGVTGGSYGGYATGWMATKYTNRFAAGVMFVGISDNISKWGTSDIPEELYLVHARKRIWDDYQFFLERSPIYYAGQAKTPLLIMAGKEDTRVDPGQSYELYRHIKTRTNTPVRLVLYPGEGHGNARATARFDYNLRMMRWFNQYLKGEKQRPDSEIDASEAGISN
ncbi:MAG: S9 family peptidase [Balneolaceae bacterium]|nr:S9 family peptidase [Balneolaceae bacterium]